MANLFSTTAYATNKVASTVPARVHGVSGYNSGAEQFVQIHDAAALPADAAVPRVVFKVAAASNFSIAFEEPVGFDVGVVVCNSSTGPTKTIGAADCWFQVELA